MLENLKKNIKFKQELIKYNITDFECLCAKISRAVDQRYFKMNRFPEKMLLVRFPEKIFAELCEIVQKSIEECSEIFL